jgi:hypothetical protein
LVAERIFLGLERFDRGDRRTALAIEGEDVVDELGAATAPARRDAHVVGLAAEQVDIQHDLPRLRGDRTRSYRVGAVFRRYRTRS